MPLCKVYITIFLSNQLKFIYSEKAAKILRNLYLFLTDTSTSQKKWRFRKKFVAFSEYMNFTTKIESIFQQCALLCSKSVVMLNRAIWVMTHEWISLKLIFSVSALCRYVKYMLNTTNVWGILNMYANSYLPLSSVVK